VLKTWKWGFHTDLGKDRRGWCLDTRKPLSLSLSLLVPSQLILLYPLPTVKRFVFNLIYYTFGRVPLMEITEPQGFYIHRTTQKNS
jgi:hypothetical protein